MAAVKVLNDNPLLNPEVVKSFIEGVTKTISLMASTNVKSFDSKFIYQFKFESEVAGVVGIATDNAKGILVLSFEKDCILKIHNNMMHENEVELTASVVDIVGELTNIVYGSAKTSLNHLGYHFQMSIPTVIHGTFQLTKKSLSPSIVVPFEIENGLKFSIALSVE